MSTRRLNIELTLKLNVTIFEGDFESKEEFEETLATYQNDKVEGYNAIIEQYEGERIADIIGIEFQDVSDEDLPITVTILEDDED